MKKEIWKDVPQTFGQYQVSSLGRVRNTFRLFSGCVKIKKCRKQILGQYSDNYGYLALNISLNNQRAYRKVHRLVAQTFIPNPENKPQVNHKNGIKTDNRVENLEWVTRKENQIHASKIGLLTFSKLDPKKVLIIKERLKNYKYRDVSKLAKEFGVSLSAISDIRHNRKWSYIN
jgi:hypothetical protein